MKGMVIIVRETVSCPVNQCQAHNLYHYNPCTLPIVMLKQYHSPTIHPSQLAISMLTCYLHTFVCTTHHVSNSITLSINDSILLYLAKKTNILCQKAWKDHSQNFVSICLLVLEENFPFCIYLPPLGNLIPTCK